MDNRNASHEKQKRLLEHYEIKDFDSFFCEESLDIASYGTNCMRAFWLINLKQANHFWSDSFYEMMGITPGTNPDIIIWVDLLQIEDLIQFSSALTQIEMDGKSREVDFTITQGSHSKKIKCCMEAIKGGAGNEIEFIAGTCYDISSGDFFEAAEKMKKLQMENKRNRQLLSMISHDFKTPFNSIMGLTEFLLHPDKVHSKEKTELYLRTILSGARNAHTMMVRLIEWAKAQNEDWQVSQMAIDMHLLINEVFNELKIIADTKKIELVNECPKETFAFTDNEMTRIVLRNLVSNAIKFSFKESHVVVKVNKRDDHLQVSVTDFGIGMENTIAEKIFQSEINEPGMGTANERGTGVGLSICRTLTEKLGGKIWVESVHGSGSTFYLMVPTVAR